MSTNYISSAIMSALGIDECIGDDLNISGECNPIDTSTVECNDIDCECQVNKQSICAIVADTFGKMFRNCDSAKTSQGASSKYGGCNSEKFILGTPVQCSDLTHLVELMIEYINSISCSTKDDIEDEGGLIINDVTFNIYNSYCKEGIYSNITSATYPRMVSIPTSKNLAQLTFWIIEEMLVIIKKYFVNVTSADAVLEELRSINIDDAANDIEMRNIYSHNLVQKLNVDVISTYVNGRCEANQSTVFVHSTKTIVKNCTDALQASLPSIKQLQIEINTTRKKKIVDQNIMIAIYIGCGVIGVALLFLLFNKMKNKKGIEYAIKKNGKDN